MLTLLQLFDLFCPGESFATWREVVRALMLLPPENLETWNLISGNRPPLTKRPRELYIAAGRGSGKTMIAALISVWMALNYRRPRLSSQRPFVIVSGRDQRQADEAMAYIRMMFNHQALKHLVAGDPARRTLTLKTGVRFEVLPSDPRKVRSRGAVCFFQDEASFLETDQQSAWSDKELLRAVRPLLGRITDSLLVVASSKHRPRGILFDASKRFGVDDPDVLYLEGATTTWNPTFDAATIQHAFREDPVSAASEYGTSWREDITDFIPLQAVEAVITKGCLERPPLPGISYRAFVDFAGGAGGGDSAVLAIGHTDRFSRREVLDLILEIRPPFSPAAVCRQFAETLARYGVHQATADKWGSAFVVEGLAVNGIRVEQNAQPRSDLYLLGLPLIMSKLVDLLDLPRLVSQLTGLERSAGGQVDHKRGGHDDVANAAIGVLTVGRASTAVQYRARIV